MRPDRGVVISRETELRELRPGYPGAEIIGGELSAVRWEMSPTSHRTALHQHAAHEQIGVLVSGSITMEVDGETRTLVPGDVYWVAPGVPHGRMIVHGPDPAVIVDVFAPPRRDHASSITIVAPAEQDQHDE